MLQSKLDPEKIRTTASEVISRSEYRLDPEVPVGAFASIYRGLMQFLNWIFSPIRWIFEWAANLPALIRDVVVVILVLLLVALVAHIVYVIVRAVRKGRYEKVDLDLSMDEIPDPSHLEQSANRFADQGDWITAVRFLFQASLVRLHWQAERQQGAAVIRKGMTNREHLARFRQSSVFDPIRLFVQTIDRKWYGDEACSLDDYTACKQAYEAIVNFAGGSRV